MELGGGGWLLGFFTFALRVGPLFAAEGGILVLVFLVPLVATVVVEVVLVVGWVHAVGPGLVDFLG